ncbi:CHAP domain-containing protein [Elioraea sp.]|uniref:CHAP domain-containing protein n=1 Tax=Elioraea sp. TaxID=2185103 RepID=UPI003F72B786
MRRRALLAGMVFGLLAGCASRTPLPAPPETVTFRTSVPLSCVPFARELSGIELSGDAHTWWRAASGRYLRSGRPAPGAVLVLRGTRRLPQGHVSVVVRQTGPREILVSHANWASGAARGAVHQNQLVVDVSRRNDWSAVRVWYPRTGQLGVTVFAAHGFIHPPRPRTPEEIAADVPRAARDAAMQLAAR